MTLRPALSRQVRAFFCFPLVVGGLLALAGTAVPKGVKGQDPPLPMPSKVCPIQPVDDEGPRLELHIFQPVCDQPLLPGKFAVGRVWAVWSELGEADENIEDIEVLVTVSDGAGRVLWNRRPHTFTRPSKRAALPWPWETMRKAGHTYNFGISGSIQSPLKVKVELVNPRGWIPFPNEATQAFEFAQKPAGTGGGPADGADRVLKIVYAFPEVGDYASRPPWERSGNSPYAWLLKNADAAEDFIVENHPIHSVRRSVVSLVPEALGDLELRPCGRGLNDQLRTCGFYGSIKADERLLSLFAEHAEEAVVVMIIPREVVGQGFLGRTWYPNAWSPNCWFRICPPMIVLPDDANSWQLAHELGHYFITPRTQLANPHFNGSDYMVPGALYTPPRTGDVPTGRTAGLQGWRSPPGAAGLGFNKHSLEGNTESVKLEALMEEGESGDRIKYRFVSDGIYEQFEYEVHYSDPDIWWSPTGTQTGATDFGNDGRRRGLALAGDFRTASGPWPDLEQARPQLRAQAVVPGIVVAGTVGRDGSAGMLDKVRPAAISPSPGGPPSPPASGPFQVDLLSSTGSVLASQSFDPDDQGWAHVDSLAAPDPWATFRAVFPRSTGAARIELSGPGGPIQSIVASSSPPSVSGIGVRYDRNSGLAAVSWNGTDPDGDALTFDVLFSPDGTASWGTVARGVLGTNIDLQAGAWRRGPDPTIRVVALDGFHAASAEARFDLDGITVSSHFPADGAVEHVDAVSASVLAELDTAAIASVFSLTDAAGTAVAATVDADPVTGHLWLVPDQPLRAGSTYNATISRSLRDLDGRTLASDVTWSFQTLPDTIGPRVVRVVPNDGDITVDPTKPVGLAFDEALDPASIAADALRLVRPNGSRVPGTTTYQSRARALVFQPDDPLDRMTLYEMQLDPAVTDEFGNAVQASGPFRFTTANSIVPEDR